jgi:hypothetical protein
LWVEVARKVVRAETLNFNLKIFDVRPENQPWEFSKRHATRATVRSTLARHTFDTQVDTRARHQVNYASQYRLNNVILSKVALERHCLHSCMFVGAYSNGH